MNRKEFFKKLGLGIAGVIIAPKVIAERKASRERLSKPLPIHVEQLPQPSYVSGCFEMPKNSHITPQEFLDEWKQIHQPQSIPYG
jgi:hypothetical protein